MEFITQEQLLDLLKSGMKIDKVCEELIGRGR